MFYNLRVARFGRTRLNHSDLERVRLHLSFQKVYPLVILKQGRLKRLKVQVIMYSRPGCHLCDVAKQDIDEADCTADYILEVVNIESDPVLLNKYRYDIPVVTINGVEAFRHQVDSKLFKEAVAKVRTGQHHSQ
jgi:hypothetical protein